MRTILLIANSSWNILNFRSGLIESLKAAGHRVEIAAPFDGSERALMARGFFCRDLRLDRKGTNPVVEGRLFLRIFGLIKNLRPDLVLGFTIKPNLYGGMACRLLSRPFAPNVTGLGTLFITRSILTRLVILLYRFAYRRAARVFFQNNDDLTRFGSLRIVRPGRAVRIPGSGINLDRFRPSVENKTSGFVFLFIGRFLLDKGIVEFVAAAALVRKKHSSARFRLLGSIDPGNRRSVSSRLVDEWRQSGIVDIMGWTDDVRPPIAASDAVVLPSYREGLAHTLLEAAAMGKPLITTDVPGCRDAVDDGVTGWLCRARDTGDLAAAMEKMIGLSPVQRGEMGRRGRRKMEREFDAALVFRAYHALINEIP